jgi:hypothetical protein
VAAQAQRHWCDCQLEEVEHQRQVIHPVVLDALLGLYVLLCLQQVQEQESVATIKIVRFLTAILQL